MDDQKHFAKSLNELVNFAESTIPHTKNLGYSSINADIKNCFIEMSVSHKDSGSYW